MINQLVQPPVRKGTHALLIGISNYPFLPGGSRYDKTVDPGLDFGMGQLTSPAISACRLAKWLAKASKQGLLPTPLATCRLVVAPSQEEMPRIKAMFPAAAITIDPDADGRFATIADALNDWRTDCNTHPTNLAWFFFAGHGLHLSNQMLLCSGYNQPKRSALDEAIVLKEIVDGMQPSNQFGFLASTQFYAVDACRLQIPSLASAKTRDFWQVAATPKNNATREYSELYSTKVGKRAYGQHLRATPFTRALIASLRNHAADREVSSTDWTVRFPRLQSVLSALVPDFARRLRDESNQPVNQTIDVGKWADIRLNRLIRSPRTHVSIRLQPEKAHPPAKLALTDRVSGSVHRVSHGKHPYSVRISPGDYDVDLAFHGQAHWKLKSSSNQKVGLPPKVEIVLDC